MRKWWGIWGGHVYAVVTILMIFAALFLLWLSVRSDDPSATFILGMAFVLAGVLAFCTGAFAAYYWNTPVQRHGLRSGLIVEGKPYAPAGRAQ
jgi:FtsH-binding integral membrane protein